ncbi:MAG: hypothetical protein GF411_18355 [Candidatus Lokiarchaeota archaeon]|nr:hypothetical protein [Candidatus Lokiarchaeota archaeon]
MTRYDIHWRGPYTYRQVIESEGYDSAERIYAVVEIIDKEIKPICLGRAVNQSIAEALQNPDCGIDDSKKDKLYYYLAKIIPKAARRSFGFIIRHKGEVPPLVRTLTIP